MQHHRPKPIWHTNSPFKTQRPGGHHRMAKFDIQAAWLGTKTSSVVVFRTGQPLADALKLDYIPITRVENACATATDAFRNACYAVAAGVYDIVLALGVEKLKDSGFSGLAVPEAPGSDVNPPVPPPSQFALGRHTLLPRVRNPLRGRETDSGPDSLQESPQRHHEPQGPLPA